jgi:hypothetical protein
MRIISITPKPDAQCVEATLALDVAIGFQRGQRIPFDLAVQVRTEDKKLLGIARPSSYGQEQIQLEASDYGNQNEATAPMLVVLALSQKHVDYLEGLRSKHRKGDVVLQCHVEAQFLVSKVVNAYLKRGPELQDQRGGSAGEAVVYVQSSGRDPFYSQTTNMWVLSGDGGRTFLQRETLRHDITVTIGSSDWLHDYAAPWRATRYMVVELPQPEILTSTPNIEQRVNPAIEAAQKATESLSKGDWNDVVEDLRPVWELLRNDADIQGLLQRDGYTPEAITAFNESVKHQFDLASKFVHRTDKAGKNVAPEIRASKEDALVCYSFAMSLLNLVSRKAFRLR